MEQLNEDQQKLNQDLELQAHIDRITNTLPEIKLYKQEQSTQDDLET